MLRPFQTKLKFDINTAWENGATNVMAVAPTGSGKTVVVSSIVKDESGASISIAHRQELISQLSQTYARDGIRHKIIGNNATLKAAISSIHMFKFGNIYLNSNAKDAIGGVDTIIKISPNDPFFNNVRLMVIDEAHHCLRENKWGKVSAYFKNARGLLPTATPLRADGKGLGRHADGIADAMILAPTMRDIINMGYLTDYRLHVPPTSIDTSSIPVSQTTGDFNTDATRKAVHKAEITGDVVQHYVRIARGKLGITFAVDVEAATELAAAYRNAGVPSEVVTAKTPDYLRVQILAAFERRELLQLVNVDLFGEGFDLPALEVVSFARPTRSFALYTQMFGRVLRLMIPKEYIDSFDNLDNEGRRAVIAASIKPYGIIIDHVNNIIPDAGGLGLPDKFIEWSLDRRQKRSSNKSTAIPIRICINPVCSLAYERIYNKCPYCNSAAPEPLGRSAPEFVDGDLIELDDSYLAKIRGEIESQPKFPYNATSEIVGAIRKRHFERGEIREILCNTIAWWAGYQNTNGYTDSQSYRLFYFKYGVDVATCQTLSAKEMSELNDRIINDLNKEGIIL